MKIDNLKEKEFISYGLVFDREKFHKARQGRGGMLNKPEGGLWASPVDSDWGWKDWCRAEEFRGKDYFKKWTKFKLKEDVKIVVIDSYYDLTELLREYGVVPEAYSLIGYETLCLDFDKLIKNFDGIYLTDSGNRECHYSGDGMKYSDLNSWDCESIVLFDCDKIDFIEVKGE